MNENISENNIEGNWDLTPGYLQEIQMALVSAAASLKMDDLYGYERDLYTAIQRLYPKLTRTEKEVLDRLTKDFSDAKDKLIDYSDYCNEDKTRNRKPLLKLKDTVAGKLNLIETKLHEFIHAHNLFSLDKEEIQIDQWRYKI